MSLQICPECKKTNPYWHIYKAINFRGFNRGTEIECYICKEKMEVDYDLKNKRKLYLIGMSWMVLPILVILLAAFGIVSYIIAFANVIIFHFGAMYYLIKRMNYLIKN